MNLTELLGNLHTSPLLDAIACAFGLCIGSFLNVLALRSLSEQNILWPPSHCPRCRHHLAPWDNIPLLSWILLQGKCRYCSGGISWQYPAVELFTGLTFVAIERTFLDTAHSPFNTAYWNHLLSGWFQSSVFTALELANNWTINARTPWVVPDNASLAAWALGALLLASTLIAVSITDFKEKLIPHEITYPSMILGILYSALVRHDLLGAMAGIGVSYILFDFIAFYGLKLYLLTHGSNEPARQRLLRRHLSRRRRRGLPRALSRKLRYSTVESLPPEEPIEVMGGGDAVLSAVMSAYLGWQLLIVSLIFGFVIGTLMGLVLLVNEMRKANLLHKCLRITAVAAAMGATVFGGLGSLGGKELIVPMGILGAVGVGLLAVVSVGTRVSKPYPFGPALAAGGFIAIFLLPNWHYLQAIAPK